MTSVLVGHLLDEVERGETVVVTRGGKRIASMGPAPVGNGAGILALLTMDVDADFASDVAAARAAVTLEGTGVARRLILDTGVLITSERAKASWGDGLEASDDVVLATVTVPELRTGAELASDSRREARAAFLEQVLATIPVESYDLAVAQAHGRLLAAVHREGAQRGAHDLIIAATAAATKRIIVTADRSARFGDLPGVRCLEVG